MKRHLLALVAILGTTAGSRATDGCATCTTAPSCRQPGPPAIAKWAIPSDGKGYNGYYVGGGVPCRGEARCASEGTWGWDYPGHLLRRKVDLQWTHGRKCQGSTGAYGTVAPSCGGQSTP